MPRFAIGDLTIDIDVPERFVCEYALTGALLTVDKNTKTRADISALRLDRDGVEATRESAKKDKLALHKDNAKFASYFRPPHTWFAGFEKHLIIATLKGDGFPEFAQVLESVAEAHDPFPADKETVISDLRASHTKWFEQRRTSLLDAISWSAERYDAPQRLDAFWADLLENPPDDEHLLNTMLSGAAVAFGDLLKRYGYEWCVAKHPFGVSIAMVAARGERNLLMFPDAFIAKRWEAQEPPFVVDSLPAIERIVKEAKKG